MGTIFKIYNALIIGLAIIAGLMLALIFVGIVADVTIRMIGFNSIQWYSAMAEYALLFSTMCGAPWLVRIKGHVFIDAVTQLLAPAIKNVVAKFAYLICVCSALVFSYFSLNLLIEAVVSGEIDTRGEDMPLWTLLFPIPFCFFLVAIEFGRYLIGIDDMYGDRTDVRDNV